MSKLIIFAFVVFGILTSFHVMNYEAISTTWQIDKVILNADLSTSKKFQNYSNSENGISNIKFPSYLSIDTNLSNYENIFGKDVVQFFPTSSTNFNNISLGATAHSLVDNEKHNITNFFKNIAVNEEYNFINSKLEGKTVSGNDIFSLTYTFSYDDGAKGVGKVFAVLKGDKIYYVDYNSDNNKDFTTFLPDVNEMIKSLILI